MAEALTLLPISSGTPPPSAEADGRRAAATPTRAPSARSRLLATDAVAAAVSAAWEGVVSRLDLSASSSSPVERSVLGAHLAVVVAPEELAPARAWLAERGLDAMPVVPWTGSSVALLSALAVLIQEAQADAGLARRSAALLRIELDQVQARFRALESFAYSLGGPRHSLALDWPAEGATLRGAPGPGRQGEGAVPGQVRQALPLDVSSIAAVEMWLPEADAADAAALDVSLLDREGLATPLTLDAASAAAGSGWLRFIGSPVVGREAQDATLVVTGLVEDVDFGLSMAVPDPDFAVQGLADAVDRVLALRVWRAVSPLALPALVGRATAGSRTVRRIMPSDMPRPSLLAVPAGASDYVAASFWAREDAILVHPSAAGPVCALVQRLPMPVPQQVSAIVNAARGDSPVLGFAIGCAPAGTVTEGDWQRHLGAWTYLAGGSWGEAHGFSAAAVGSSCDLVLATCVASAAPNDNAWALFRAFRLAWDTA